MGDAGAHLQVQEDLLQQAAAALVRDGVQHAVHAGLAQGHVLLPTAFQVFPFQTDD